MRFDKQKTIYLILAIIAIILSITAIILRFVQTDKSLTATDIYTRCLQNVVEVKASSDSIGESFGTGEILTEDGKIITNAHVVTYTRLGETHVFEDLYIRFSFEDNYRKVTLEDYDGDIDLAVLKADGLTDFKPIKTGDSAKLKAGQKVWAVGNAANYGIGIFEGIISLPLVNIMSDGVQKSVIQCDITIAAGNSGGALLNDKGELIGVTTFRTKDNSGNVIYGIVYCIPVNSVLEYIDKI